MDDNKKKRPRARRIPEEIRAEKNTDGTQNQLQRPDTVPEASAAQTENAATPAPAAKPVENVPAARVQPRPEVRPTQNAPRPARTLKGESAKNPAQPSAPAEKSTENTAAARVQPRPEVRLIQNAPRPARTPKDESVKNPAQPSAPTAKPVKNASAARVQPHLETRPAQSIPPSANSLRTETKHTDAARNTPNRSVPEAPSSGKTPVSSAENEKTKLTSAQPKSKLKTPVREKAPVRDEGGGTASVVFKAIIYMTVVLLVSVVLAYAAIVIANDAFAFVKSDEAVEVVIPENATVADIADILGDAGVIEYPTLFKLFASFKKETGTDEDGNSVFIPGTYTISPMNNYMQLLNAFKKQYTREVVWVTIPEGSTVEDIISILVDEYGIASRSEFIHAINEYDYELDFIADIDMTNGRYYRLEGYLFPDTYQFYTDSSAETVVYRMLTNFRKKLSYIGKDNCSERLAELGMTLDQVVTLASMIEKEVKYAVDYENVSSVFHNRLAAPAEFPRLDSDATTVYAIQMATGVRPETLGAEELAFDSPYNTRKVGGFPPSAIGNPGYEALYCAFYPAKTNYYYFVADNSGYNLYARTNAAHQQNVAAVRKEAEQ